MMKALAILNKTVALSLVALLVAVPTPRASAEVAAAPEPAPEPALTITILEGEGALNNIRDRTAREPIVQVTDENHKPVSGAAVLFLIHDGPTGAGGSFGPDATVKTLTVKTDALGQAHATGLTPNQHTGDFSIAVVATLEALQATAVIHMSNFPGPVHGKDGHHKHLTKTQKIIITVGTIIVVGIIIVVLSTRSHTSAIKTGGGGVGPPTVQPRTPDPLQR